MRRNNDKTLNFGPSVISQTLLYQHMSNHYRRILNARKVVDTAPPAAYKSKHYGASSATSSPVRSSSANNKKFIRRNSSPTPTERSVSAFSSGGSYWGTESCYGKKFHNPKIKDCCCKASDIDWEVKKEKSNFEIRNSYEAKKSENFTNFQGTGKQAVNKCKIIAPHKRKISVKDKAPKDIMEKHSKFFISYNNSFHPRILKTNAVSKLKSLRVYHPLQKKSGKARALFWKDSKEPKASVSQIDIMTSNCNSKSCQKKTDSLKYRCKQTTNAREPSQTSSRDSAYNGGVSSLPESRSPTPDHRKQKCCRCRCHGKESETYYENVRIDKENLVVPTLRLTDNQNTQTEIIETCDPITNKKEIDCRKNFSSSTKSLDFKKDTTSETTLNMDLDREGIKRNMKEEALYTNFVKDITAEVLQKGLYTNKALMKVMKKHIMSNMWLLDKNRMLQEVDKLRIQLGIPEDQDLLNPKLESAGSTADISDLHSAISDSGSTDFSVQKRQIKSHETCFASSQGSKDTIQKCASNAEKFFPKSISDVLYRTEENEITLDSNSDDEDDELVSVIQVTKLIREKRKSDACDKIHSEPLMSLTRGNSADESEQSSDHVTRKKKSSHLRFRKTEKTSSSSESVVLSPSERRQQKLTT